MHHFVPGGRRHVGSRPRAALVAVVTVAFVLSGCAWSENSSGPHAQHRPIGTLGAGFFDPAKPPPPEGMIRPTPGSWDAVHPPRGYRVVLLSVGDDPATTTLVTAVTQWAKAEHVGLTTMSMTAPDGFVAGVAAAMELEPDLVISTGHALIDALALVTASHLDQQFLVLGAQLPEPTVNVTAAIWQGASRGREGPEPASSFLPETFTHERADAALRAGVASVLHDLTGIVIWLD